MPRGTRLLTADQADIGEHPIDRRHHPGRGLPPHLGCGFAGQEAVVITSEHFPEAPKQL